MCIRDRNEAVQNEKIKSLPGVLTVIEQSGQTQVVLGDRVPGGPHRYRCGYGHL